MSAPRTLLCASYFRVGNVLYYFSRLHEQMPMFNIKTQVSELVVLRALNKHFCMSEAILDVILAKGTLSNGSYDEHRTSPG